MLSIGYLKKLDVKIIKFSASLTLYENDFAATKSSNGAGYKVLFCVGFRVKWGPYGEQDEEQIFIQKVVPDTDTMYVRLASNGKRVCTIRSVDGSAVSCFAVAECEGALRPRRLLLCGHRSGATQMWDLTGAIDKAAKPAISVGGGSGGAEGEESPVADGGPTADELVRLLSACDLDAAPVPLPLPLPPSPHRPLP